MHDGQTMTYAQLQQEARSAMEGRTQSDVAKLLDVSRATVAQAVTNDTEHKYKKTLSAIVAACTDLQVDYTYTLRSKDGPDYND